MITVAGESLIDLVSEGNDRYRALPGGGPCNVAVALARLDIPTSLLARVSGDAFGQQLRAHVRINGVSERDLVAAREPTTLAVVTLDDHGQARYDFHANGSADWQWRHAELPDALSADVEALCVGTLAMMLPPGATVLEEFVHAERDRGQVTVVYDPNLRPSLAAGREVERARVERQAALADVVKVSKDDLAWIYPEHEITGSAAALRGLGPQLVIVTRGRLGSYATGPGALAVHRPAPATQVVDTVGAGDAFCAGLLAALRERKLLGPAGRVALAHLDEATLSAILDEATMVASLTCQRPGADPPTAAALRQERLRPGS